MFSYKPLWKLLIEKNMSKTEFRLKCNITTKTLADMNKDKNVSMDTLNKICNVLECTLVDIVDHIPD